MGKLQEALNKAKKNYSDARGPGNRRVAPVGGVEAGVKDAEDLWPNLVRYETPDDQLEKSRLIAGLEASTGPVMAYNMLRTRVIKRLRDNGWKSFMVTSPDPRAGKSLTLLNLAFSIAREQTQRVYLIDADFRVPSLHRYLGVTPTKHLTTYLDNECGIDDVISSVGPERLFVAFNTVQHEHSAELLTSPRMKEFVAELRSRDPEALIIFDTPPLLVADDVLAFSQEVDALLLVLAEGQTDREDVVESLQLTSEINILGVVLNRSRDLPFETYY